jgi:hypothetical protein
MCRKSLLREIGIAGTRDTSPNTQQNHPYTLNPNLRICLHMSQSNKDVSAVSLSLCRLAHGSKRGERHAAHVTKLHTYVCHCSIRLSPRHSLYSLSLSICGDEHALIMPVTMSGSCPSYRQRTDYVTHPIPPITITDDVTHPIIPITSPSPCRTSIGPVRSSCKVNVVR